MRYSPTCSEPFHFFRSNYPALAVTVPILGEQQLEMIIFVPKVLLNAQPYVESTKTSQFRVNPENGHRFSLGSNRRQRLIKVLIPFRVENVEGSLTTEELPIANFSTRHACASSYKNWLRRRKNDMPCLQKRERWSPV